jgi:hypothetical protein
LNWALGIGPRRAFARAGHRELGIGHWAFARAGHGALGEAKRRDGALGKQGIGQTGHWANRALEPITNYQLPITNYQLPITNYQLPITNYQLPITNDFFFRD